ncbi:lamin tail domain-containing protein [Actinoplanes friuliensis]|uniref:LTD domain-containing protein n=1 Tax=Actinoplanes friuliensis DSM 7358 TaxID=1246995 RepID=U5VY60_9ACTN|nr:lamin tail domain-containing protein [Actinoplanes friuliensis]AGZ41829.1 hypothetical protein AFR_17755 [Actinoplanes friuliensis DSM 7358]
MLRRLAALSVAGVLAAGSLVAGPAAPAVAASAPCLPDGTGPVCQVWTGKVTYVNDGDTMSVDLAGDGTSTPRSIRFINVQAMEQTVYSSVVARRRGECHSLAATARVEQLVKAGQGVVRLTAQNASSSSKNRPLRSVAVKIDGVWRDLGLDLLSHGLTLWQPFGGEWAWNAQYRAAQAAAARKGLNLFDTDSCGTGPAQSAPLGVLVNYDPPGPDQDNLNGEWVRISNAGDKPVSLAKWWVRDSALRRYTFPSGTLLPAGGAVVVHAGSGTDTATDKHWRQTAPVFDNPTFDEEARGDGAYLFDPQGDLRAWTQYPSVPPLSAGA